MKSRLYMCPRYKKSVKSISSLIKYVNVCKIPNFLLYYQFLNSKLVLNYNKINPLDIPSDNNKKDISSKRLNNGKEEIGLADRNKNKKNIR